MIHPMIKMIWMKYHHALLTNDHLIMPIPGALTRPPRVLPLTFTYYDYYIYNYKYITRLCITQYTWLYSACERAHSRDFRQQ